MMAPFSPTSRKEREGNDDSDADGHRGQMMNFSAAGEFDGALLDFCDRDLLDCIDFDDFFVDEALQLPHLDIDDDPEMVLTEWTACTSEGDEAEASVAMEKADGVSEGNRADGGAYCSGSGSGSSSGSDSDAGCGGERDNDEKIQSDGSGEDDVKIRGGGVYKRKKSEAQRKITSQAKRKHKVDWTPDLHKRFVQAVDQLGVEKAVPSKILELMAIDSLTRHNIASHLQKYRSRRKHSVAREAKAMNWTQQRHQMYGGAAIAGGSKRVMIPWSPPAPAVGFPPMAPTNHFIGPLHVWGHPTSSTEQLVMHAWLEHPPPSTWTHPAPIHHLLSPPPLLPLLLPPDPSYWHQHRFKVAAPVQGIPHQEMHKLADPGPTMGVPAAQPLVDSSQPPFDLHLSKESIDAAVGEALSEPWKPLPLGLKPPSLDSVLLELQRQGIPSIPPPSTTSIT